MNPSAGRSLPMRSTTSAGCASRMLTSPRPSSSRCGYPSAAATTTIPWSSCKSRPRRRADLTVRSAAFLALILVALADACAPAAPTRRDLVVGLVGEPRTVFDDDPSARFLAAAVTESLVRRDAHDELVPRLAESVPTLENGGPRGVADHPAAPGGRPAGTIGLRGARRQD